MDYRVLEGSSFTASIEMRDDDELPVIPAPGYPKAVLMDDEKNVIGTYPSHPGADEAMWEASISVPMFGLKKVSKYRIKWKCKASNGDKYVFNDYVFVAPKVEERFSEIVVLPEEQSFSFVLPFEYKPEYAGTISLYHNNMALLAASSLNGAGVDMDYSVDTTEVTLPVPEEIGPSLQASLVTVRAKYDGRTRTYSYRLWNVTPQVLVASQMLEGFLNKARIENVIPELRYNEGDLLSYLERGLYFFNYTGYPTGYNGMNMQGAILDAWLICSTYWAISSQLIAEGSLSFDVSGQGISLNVDRTPQLDSALGRIESRIQDTVIPLKKQLCRQGLTDGDGSVGSSSMRNPYSTGSSRLSNAPSTRINGFSPYLGRRF